MKIKQELQGAKQNRIAPKKRRNYITNNKKVKLKKETNNAKLAENEFCICKNSCDCCKRRVV